MKLPGSRRLRSIVTAIFLSVITLVAADVILTVTGAFPPVYRYGDPELGTGEPVGTGQPRCLQSTHWRFLHSDSGLICLNERGFRSTRTIAEILRSARSPSIAVLGDSHTDLPFANWLVHTFVLERELRRLGLSDAEVFNAGRGGYSPLQAYLYFKKNVSDLRPSVLLIHLYTGNDFFDLVRTDDRPFFVSADSGGYRVEKPRWFRYRDPALRDSWQSQSRVLFLVNRLAIITGTERVSFRVRSLLTMAHEQGKGILHAASYMLALSATEEPELAFPPAYAAQILNQHLFFSYFPQAYPESVRRLAYLIAWIRSEYPDLVCALSPLPSAALAGALQRDSLFLRRLSRVDLSPETVLQEEQALYDSAMAIGRSNGWMVIDNLTALRHHTPCEELYLPEDLHLSPVGSSIIGQNEANALMAVLGRASTPSGSAKNSPPGAAGGRQTD